MFFCKKLSFQDVCQKYFEESKNNFDSVMLLIPDNILQCSFSKIKYLDWVKVINDNDEKDRRKLKKFITHIYDFYSNNVTVIKNYGSLLDVKMSYESQPKTPFSEYEIQQLWLKKDNVTIQHILVLIYTGMRIGEYLNLKKDDIDLTRRILIVRKSKTLAGTNRLIPIHKDIVPFLEKLPNLDYGAFYKRYKKIMKELGMNHTIHECRHTFSTIISKTKARRHLIKKILGHANHDVTNRYIHIQLNDLLNTIDLLKGQKLIDKTCKKNDFYLR